MANYLYNGVSLPALPEWDKETFPYAAILQHKEYNTRTLAVRANAIPYSYLEDRAPPAHCLSLGLGLDSTESDDEWEELHNTIWMYADLDNDYTLIWSNHNVIDTDSNEIYLAASEPVPVTQYTATFDLKSFLMGIVDELAGRP